MDNDDTAKSEPDRASESVVSTGKMPPVKQTPAISSGPFEIAALSAPGSDPPPLAAPAMSIETAMGRSRGVTPLSRIVTIGIGVFVVVVLVIVLALFR